MLLANPTVRLQPFRTQRVDHAQRVWEAAKGMNRVQFRFGDQAIALEVPLDDSLVFGRSHPTNQVQPDFDLSPFGGMTNGTSRVHAALRHRSDGWWLEDLGSSNGTWLEGERLAPFVATPIRRASLVRLANLEFWIMLPDPDQ